MADSNICSSNTGTPPQDLALLGEFNETPDIMHDVQNLKNRDSETGNEIHFPIPNMINEDQYHGMLVNLNQKQREYLLHVLHAFKCGKPPFYDCVLGGAEVGKSRLIEALN